MCRLRRSLVIVAVIGVQALEAAGQVGALYPAVDLPLTSTVSPATAGDATAPARPDASDAAASAPAIAADFDASHFTPSPDLDVRDLNGDGHLDGTWLVAGVHVWLGRGDGRFDEGTFQPTTIFSTSSVVGQWADMNGDGRLDAVFLSFTEVEVFYDQGDGSFVTSGPQPLPPGGDYSFNSWTVGYVDGDAHPDIVARNGSGFPGTSMNLLRGLGGASFADPVIIATPQGFVDEIALADINGDGLTDIVAEFQLTGPYKLRTWTQTAAGTFTQHPVVTLPNLGVFKLEVRDMTGDGVPDVVVHQSGTVLLYVGNGTGVLPATGIALPGVLSGAFFVDVDRDGLVDVLQADTTAPFGPSVVFARPDGSLSPPVITRHTVKPIGTGDFDGDGVLDLFSTQAALHGRGDGSFDVPRNFAIGEGAASWKQLVLDDFNEDGRVDVVAFDGFDGLSATMSTFAASWNDPHTLIEGGTELAGASGDLNGDGHADLVGAHDLFGGTDFWLGHGDGTFKLQPKLEMGGQSVSSGLGIGQFDADAPLDVVAASDGQLRVRVGLGALAFGVATLTPLPAGAVHPTLVVRDLDGDGMDDVIVLQETGVYTFHASGHGRFDAGVQVSAPATQLTVADIDGDGDDDVLETSGFKVIALVGDGAGHFAPAPFADVTADRLVGGTAVADVDGDGLLDLALGHAQAWSLHLGVPGGGWAPQPVDVFDLPGSGQALRFQDVNADGHPDLLAFGSGSTANGVGLTLALQSQGPWADAGFALPGVDGPPFLWPTGALHAGQPMSLLLRDAAPGAAAFLVAGLSERLASFKGGVLVPDPLLLLPMPPTTSKGVTSLAGPWPVGVPAGTQLWLQTWITDAAGPAGFAASNAIVGTAP